MVDRGIRGNVLVPGAIDTGFRGILPAEVREEFEQDVISRVPLGRIGTADEAAYVTAGQYAVDGGPTKR